MLQNIPSTIPSTNQAIKVGYVERYCKVTCDDLRCARMFNFILGFVHENSMTIDFETQEETFPEIVQVMWRYAMETSGPPRWFDQPRPGRRSKERSIFSNEVVFRLSS
jgi:hypothetical protein